MTMPRLAAMEAEWEKRPSITSCLSYVGQYFGMEVKSTKNKPKNNVGSALELARQLQSMG